MIKSWYLIIVAAVFAVLFHSNLNRSVWADFGWAFSQYLETIAILSQFILFNKKVRNNLILGRIDRNIHISFYCSPSYFKNSFIDFLDFHIHLTKWVQSGQSIKSITWVCGILVHGNSGNSSFHYGWFHVLLGKGCQKRIRCATSHLYLISIALYMFFVFSVIIIFVSIFGWKWKQNSFLIP